MIKILIILIVVIFWEVLTLCKVAQRADENAQIILKRHRANRKSLDYLK